jgi:hypothetical protein
VLEADVRRSWLMPCGDVITLPPPVAQSTFRTETIYPSDLPRLPLLRTAIRLGIETPQRYPLVRATFGGGAVLSDGRAFFGTAALGVGTRSAGTRVFAELETSVSRASVEAVYTTVTQDGSAYTTDARAVREVAHPMWTSLHVGVEFPLGTR